jgi:hypothetical protein
METDTEFKPTGRLSASSGYFDFGEDTLFGRCASGLPAGSPGESLANVGEPVVRGDSSVGLPFDAAEIVNNLRTEAYRAGPRSGRSLQADSAYNKLYNLLRPALPVAVRRELQRLYLGDWETLCFPHWPVDTTVENVFERLLILLMKSQGITRMPFIWFWPEGRSSCTAMTHDVETPAGRDFCHELMDLDDRWGIKSSFQVIPEGRYLVPEAFLEGIRERGFEINIHDLNHDGLLYSSREEFLRRAEKINAYATIFASQGFRSGTLHRNTAWYGALDFVYDMSIPNVAHLDPQRGGCCTVFPYFIGDILELPVTTTQDYSLFHILNDGSIDLWKKQISLILRKHGLISFITHPDYLVERGPRGVYAELLAHLAELRAREETWIAPPGEVAAWWKLRSQMMLTKSGNSWRIEGKSRERARLAYASLDGDALRYEVH